jgi:peptidoglycan hydrolase-like protein with peptidoglycan-binding domain
MNDIGAGGEVSSLQRFLVNQNYPGGGAWMVTGNFGPATEQAVKNFQSQRGLAQTGIVDAQTRSAMATCGAWSSTSYSATPSTPSYTYPYTYGYTYAYPYSYQNPYSYTNIYAAPTLSSVEPNSTQQGTMATVRGSGFDMWATQVKLGGLSVPANVQNANTATFVVPTTLAPGVYQVSLSSSGGTSQTLPMTVLSAYVYPGYGVSACSYGACGNESNVALHSMVPTGGATGSSVTVYGTGFSRKGNTVHFGAGVVTNIMSFDGASLSFNVPNQLVGYGTGATALGTYNVSVTNALGLTSNVLPYTVTSIASPNAPTIRNVNGPANLQSGALGTWTTEVNLFNNQTVTVSAAWGDENQYTPSMAPQTVSGVGGVQILTFTHAYQNAGIYTPSFTVTDSMGRKNSVTANMVTVSGSVYSGGGPTLFTLSPNQGRVGTVVGLYGASFALAGNTVHFGIGGASNLASANNGTALFFVIPPTVNVCDTIGTGCTSSTSVVTPGTYPIYVSNSMGRTTNVNFTVLP